MKFIRNLIISFILLAVALYCGYQYVLTTYGVDLLRTAKEL